MPSVTNCGSMPRSTRRQLLSYIVLCLLCGLFALPGVLMPAPAVYVPSLFLLGVTFSATWPAFFTLSARGFVADRTAYSTAAGLATQIGISLCIWMASALGNRMADIAEEEGHHPDFNVHYSQVEVTIWTHAVGGLTENDFILAAKIDSLFG